MRDRSSLCATIQVIHRIRSRIPQRIGINRTGILGPGLRAASVNDLRSFRMNGTGRNAPDDLEYGRRITGNIGTGDFDQFIPRDGREAEITVK